MGETTRNPTWQRDELILALDLYFRHNPAHISKQHKEVIALSNLLNSLPIHDDHGDAQTFRNANGVYMKLCNFLRFDPSYKGSGLTRGGRLEAQVWEEFSSSKEDLHRIAEAIIGGSDLALAYRPPIIDEDEDEFPEGRVLYRVHRSRERNRTLVKKVKRAAEAAHRLHCAACGFDFFAEYGEIGRGFIEVHHTVPVSEYSPGQKTRLADLVLVCGNCHRMLHRRRPWLTIDELKSLRLGND